MARKTFLPGLLSLNNPLKPHSGHMRCGNISMSLRFIILPQFGQRYSISSSLDMSITPETYCSRAFMCALGFIWLDRGFNANFIISSYISKETLKKSNTEKKKCRILFGRWESRNGRPALALWRPAP